MADTWQREIVPAMSGLAWRLSAGSLLRVVDVEGGQSGDVFAVAADDVEDGQSNGRSFDYGGTIRLSTGSIVLTAPCDASPRTRSAYTISCTRRAARRCSRRSTA